MDLLPLVIQKAHDKIRDNIHEASKAVAGLLMKQAVKEEQQRTCLEEEIEIENYGKITDLGVSGNGTWQKRGHTSAFGVCSLIGVHSNKVLDVNNKSTYCKTCEVWSKHEDIEEYNK